ncbi:eCIS core domain-containing protein [Rhizobacter sp. P5_C2]
MKDFVLQREAEAEQGRAAADRGTAQRKTATGPLANGARLTAQRRAMDQLGMTELVQRMAEDDEEEPLQAKREPVQRVEGDEEEEPPLQGRFADAAVQRQSASEDNSATQAEADEANGGLPAQLRAGIEALSGMDMAGVRVHRNSSQPAQLNALAYAQGNDIHLGPGQEQHLPHEAWHVVQQRQGRVPATTRLAQTNVNDDQSLEREADAMGINATRASVPSQTNDANERSDALSGFSLSAMSPGRGYIGTMQLKKQDAENYIVNENLGIKSDKESVAKYINDTTKSTNIRKGLLDAWNHNTSPRWTIQEPVDFGATSSSSGMEIAAALGGYDSDEGTPMNKKTHKTLRRQESDYTGESMTTSISKEDFRESSIELKFTNGYKFSSTASGNLIHGKGFSTGQSSYMNVFRELRKAGGNTNDRAIATLLRDGLLDMPKFTSAISVFNEDSRNKFNFALSLFFNEIVGRSTSNLIEIVAILEKTITENDNDLFRRFQEYALLLPLAKEHKQIGGQKLSRIGHGTIDESKLDTDLKDLLQRNRRFHTAMQTAAGAKDTDEFMGSVKKVIDTFVENFQSNVTMTEK